MKYFKTKFIKYFLYLLFIYCLYFIIKGLIDFYTLFILFILLIIFYIFNKKLFKKIVYKIIYKKRSNKLSFKNKFRAAKYSLDGLQEINSKINDKVKVELLNYEKKKIRISIKIMRLQCHIIWSRIVR